MTSREFCYWLQGYFEVAQAGQANTLPLSFDQIETIRRRLAAVSDPGDCPRWPTCVNAERPQP